MRQERALRRKRLPGGLWWGLILGLLWWGWVGEAQATTVSFSIRLPRGIKDRSGYKSIIYRVVRSRLRGTGFRVGPGKFRLRIAVTSFRERYRPTRPPACKVKVQLLVIYTPKNSIVMTTSAHGRSSLSGVVERSEWRSRYRNQVREHATRFAVRGIVENFQEYLDKLGRREPIPLRTVRRGRGKRRKGGNGRPLRGRQPQLKPQPASVDRENDLTPPKKKTS